MVKKLFKHEILYYVRTLSIFLPWVLLLGVLSRIFLSVNKEHFVLDIVKGSSAALLVISAVALMFFAFAIGIVRFYKNIYSSEGYLTFSLPVTNFQHILVKLIVSVLVLLLALAFSLSSLSIAFSGEPLKSIFMLIGDAFRFLASVADVTHIVFYVIEAVLIAIVAVFSSPLLFYACISLGQLAKKNRILLAIGVYYLHSMIGQVLATIVIILFAGVAQTPLLESLVNWGVAHPYASIHILMIGILIVQIALAALYFFVTFYVMNKKLNLE